MKTRIKSIGDMTIVSIDGFDYETQDPLKENLRDVLIKTDQVAKKVIVNMENLEFVGSSGISNFVSVLKEFNQLASIKPRYCNVKSEFKRIMKAFDEEAGFEFFESEERAKKSFDQ